MEVNTMGGGFGVFGRGRGFDGCGGGFGGFGGCGGFDGCGFGGRFDCDDGFRRRRGGRRRGCGRDFDWDC